MSHFQGPLSIAQVEDTIRLLQSHLQQLSNQGTVHNFESTVNCFLFHASLSLLWWLRLFQASVPYQENYVQSSRRKSPPLRRSGQVHSHHRHQAFGSQVNMIKAQHIFKGLWHQSHLALSSPAPPTYSHLPMLGLKHVLLLHSCVYDSSWMVWNASLGKASPNLHVPTVPAPLFSLQALQHWIPLHTVQNLRTSWQLPLATNVWKGDQH